MFAFPHGYGDNRIVLLARDPWWLFAYWEIKKETEEKTICKIEKAGEALAKFILRVYDITGVTFNGENARSFFDIELKGLASNWYININVPDSAWAVDIGIISNKGNFYLLARSNSARTPRFGMSDSLDSEWMAPEEAFRKMFAISGGMGIGKGSSVPSFYRQPFRRRTE